MENSNIETLKTLRAKLVKDHKSTITLLDKQIETLELEDKNASTVGNGYTTSFGDSPIRGAGIDGVRRYDLNIPEDVKAVIKDARTSKYDYNIVGIENGAYGAINLHTSWTININEVSTDEGTVVGKIAITYSLNYNNGIPAYGTALVNVLESLMGVKTHSFMRTLLKQSATGGKQIAVTQIPDTKLVAVNVTLTLNGTIGRPVTYLFSDVPADIWSPRRSNYF